MKGSDGDSKITKEEIRCFLLGLVADGQGEMDKPLAKMISDYKTFSIDINVKRDRIKIREQFDFVHKNNSVLEKFPELSIEWDYDKNGTLTPSMFSYASSMKVWWICPLGHSYESTISSRTYNNCGCPYCAGKKVLKGFNDLLTLDPQIASEWDYEKNYGLVNKQQEDISTPDKVTLSSGYNVWWICSVCGKEFYTSPNNRHKGHGCPICAKQRQGVGRKAVMNLDTGEIFRSISDAQKATGAKRISAVCSGKDKSSGGFRWKYVEEQE